MSYLPAYPSLPDNVQSLRGPTEKLPSSSYEYLSLECTIHLAKLSSTMFGRNYRFFDLLELRSTNWIVLTQTWPPSGGINRAQLSMFWSADWLLTAVPIRDAGHFMEFHFMNVWEETWQTQEPITVNFNMLLTRRKKLASYQLVQHFKRTKL